MGGGGVGTRRRLKGLGFGRSPPRAAIPRATWPAPLLGNSVARASVAPLALAHQPRSGGAVVGRARRGRPAGHRVHSKCARDGMGCGWGGREVGRSGGLAWWGGGLVRYSAPSGAGGARVGSCDSPSA
eukprot:8268263-Pyramimonas_sp.AAC.3